MSKITHNINLVTIEELEKQILDVPYICTSGSLHPYKVNIGEQFCISIIEEKKKGTEELIKKYVVKNLSKENTVITPIKKESYEFLLIAIDVIAYKKEEEKYTESDLISLLEYQLEYCYEEDLKKVLEGWKYRNHKL